MWNYRRGNNMSMSLRFKILQKIAPDLLGNRQRQPHKLNLMFREKSTNAAAPDYESIQNFPEMVCAKSSQRCCFATLWIDSYIDHQLGLNSYARHFNHRIERQA